MLLTCAQHVGASDERNSINSRHLRSLMLSAAEVEAVIRNDEVVGSIPISSTKMKALTVPGLVILRSTWGNNALTTSRKLTRLGGFFSFCIQNGWLTNNPALKITRATVSSIPTGRFP